MPTTSELAAELVRMREIGQTMVAKVDMNTLKCQDHDARLARIEAGIGKHGDLWRTLSVHDDSIQELVDGNKNLRQILLGAPPEEKGGVSAKIDKSISQNKIIILAMGTLVLMKGVEHGGDIINLVRLIFMGR